MSNQDLIQLRDRKIQDLLYNVFDSSLDADFILGGGIELSDEFVVRSWVEKGGFCSNREVICTGSPEANAESSIFLCT